MNQTPHHSTDHTLTTVYTQQADLYGQLVTLSDDLSVAISQRNDTETVLSNMSKVMDQIAHLNQQVAPVRDEWTSSGCQPSAELAQAIKSVEKLIVTLIKQIDTAESSAQQAKNAMVPTLSEENARRRMRAAYASASRHA